MFRHFKDQTDVKPTTLFEFVFDLFTGRNYYYSYCKKLKKAEVQMHKDLDVLQIISDIRELKVQNKTLFTIDQRKLSKRLAKREISAADTVSSDETPPPADEKEKKALQMRPMSEKLNFLTSVFDDLNKQNRRFLAMYLK